MVQRKVPNKLGIQADHVKSEKRSLTMKPSSSQYQDGKSRGGSDLKKKMKKSRSIKLSDIESLRSSSPLRQNISQLDVPISAPIPQKQSLIKVSDGSPNYMKSTSSFDARKERSQVSPRNSQTGSDGKNPSRRNSNYSKLGSASGHKQANTLTRTSSLKLVRTLTKTPSFKPVRASVKKCSQVALCADLNAQRATCSSTLKDSKFPAYIMLNPGGTEYEGTSVMKVCPYTYCSLNGHHHAPLPPLKCFLSARRRLLKTQKSTKLEGLTPPRAKPLPDGMKEIDTGQLLFDEKPAIQEVDLDGLAVSPPTHEVGMDFFIEIYAKNREDPDETIGRSTRDTDDFTGKLEGHNDTMSSVESDDETTMDHDDEQVAESLSDGSPQSEIDFEENLDQNSDLTEMDITETFPEEDQKVEAAGEYYSPSSAQEETTPACFFYGSDLEGESPASNELDESISEASDMEWEEGQFSASHLDNEADNSTQADDESDLKIGYSTEIEYPYFHDEPIFKSDGIVSNCFEEILAEEVLQEVCEEETATFEAKFEEGDFESDSTYQNSEIDESSQVTDSLSHDQFSWTEDAFEGLTTTEEIDGTAKTHDFISTVITSASTEPIEEPTAAGEESGVSEAEKENAEMDPQVGDDETNCAANVADEAFIEHQENESLEEVYQFDAVIEENKLSEGGFDESLGDSETDQNVATSDFGAEQELPNADAEGEMEEKEQADDAKSLVEIQISDSSFKADQDTTMEDNDESHRMIEVCQLVAIPEYSKSSRASADESLPAESQDHVSDEQFDSSNIVENQNHSEKDQGEAEKFKVSSPVDSAEQKGSEKNKSSSVENSIGEAEKMEVEDSIESGAAEIFLKANNITNQHMENAFFHAGSNSNEELPNTCQNTKGTTRCKRPIKDWEEPREFNPREPNYLPVEPDPDAEKVDLRHQMTDERKNAEEWMVDYALRKAVTKLAPARKRRVALLVEAFETVMPIPKFETNTRHTSAAFSHARPIQACR